MVSKEHTFNFLVLLSLISFGIFGSFSHIFNLAILVVLALYFLSADTNFFIHPSAKKLYFISSSVFYLFLIRGIFHTDTQASIASLSPMLPIPIIGLMILFTSSGGLRVNAHQLERYAKIAVFTTFGVYIFFSKVFAFKLDLTEHFMGRLEIFSGNPIPFSTALFGVTVFCFSNWRCSKNHEKLITIACLFIGFWLAGIASGTRGTLLAIIIILPVIVCLIMQSWYLVMRSWYLVALISLFVGTIFWFLLIYGGLITDSNYLTSISNGLDTLINKSNADGSIYLRMQMWSASVSTIRDNLFWGHDISNRFTALLAHFPETFNRKFTHPHNDIFAGAIGAGLIGGLLSVVSLLSPVWAALLSRENIKERLFLGILVTLGLLITANVNTVFFNDITAAWLAFSTFLIWNLTYLKREEHSSTI